MPLTTNKYKMPVFGFPGDIYSASADQTRTEILENELVSYLDLIGGGVITGYNVFKSLSDPLKVVIDEGRAIVPFEFTRTATVNGILQSVSETHHYGVRHEEQLEESVDVNKTTGIFLTATADDRKRGSFSFMFATDIVRNAFTTSDANSYKIYTIEGTLPPDSQLKINIRVFVNSKLIRSGYAVAGNSIVFSHKRLPTDTVTVRVEPKDSLLISIVTANNDKIVSIDNGVRINLRAKFGDELVGDALKNHRHDGTEGNPSKVVLTTSTYYVEPAGNDINRTVYTFEKAKLVSNTGMTSEWDTVKGKSLLVNGAVLTDATSPFIGVDKVKGYFINPNLDQSKYLTVVSNSESQIIADGNIEEFASSGDNYLLVPYEIRISVNGLEQYFGYHLVDDDNATITVKFDGSLEDTDIIRLKLFYIRSQSEISGILDIESDSPYSALSRNINFSGENFKSGKFIEGLIPSLDHEGRTKERLVPFISNLGDADTGWKTDTVDGITYRPRTDKLNSLRDVLWIHKAEDAYYICANNTIVKAERTRLFDSSNFIPVGYPDMYRPIKIVECSGTMYAFNDSLIIQKTVTGWDEFVNLTTDINGGIHPFLSQLSAQHVYDVTSDSEGRLYVATDVGLFMIDRQFARTKQWFKLSASAFNAAAVYEKDSYAVFCSTNNQGSLMVSDSKPVRILVELASGTKTLIVSDATSFSVGDQITITDLAVEPFTAFIQEKTGNKLTLTIPAPTKFAANRAMVIKSITAIAGASGIIARGLNLKSDSSLICVQSSAISVIDAADIESKSYDVQTIAAPSGGEPLYAAECFGSTLFSIMRGNAGLWRYDGDWTLIENDSYDTDISLSAAYFILPEETEYYVGSSDGIYQSSTNSSNSQSIQLRNASIYLLRPLDLENNIFKTKTISGTVGFIDSNVKYVSGERSLYVVADLSQAETNVYIRFTSDGGGKYVGEYMRVLSYETINASKKLYRIYVDHFDGTEFISDDFAFGQTFDVVPAVIPVPIVNGIPQKSAYTTSPSTYTVYFGTQKVVFSDNTNWLSEVTIATGFKKFAPKRGDWNSELPTSVYLNGRDITKLSGSLYNISLVKQYNAEAKNFDILTKFTATNKVFRGLNLSARKLTLTSPETTFVYDIEFNDEASLFVNGDKLSIVTNVGLVSPTDVNYDIKLVSFQTENDLNKYVILGSPVTSEDFLNISIRGQYITGAGKYSHKEIQDHFSIEEAGLTHGLQTVRGANALQLLNSLKEFVTSIPDMEDTYLNRIKFNGTDAIDLINSTIENTKTSETSQDPGELSFNVYCVLYSAVYGGLYALTDRGVFFRKEASSLDTFPRWEKLADLIDTINAEGVVDVDDTNPAGIYIGYDKYSKEWTVSWGGFHESVSKNSGLTDISVIGIQFNRQKPSEFYAATEKHGILKGINSGNGFRSLNNYSAYSDLSGTKIKDIKLDPFRPNVLYLVTDYGLYHSMDGGESFDLLIRATEDIQKPESNCVSLYKGSSGTDHRVFYGGSSLYFRTSSHDIDVKYIPEFTRLKAQDISFEYETLISVRDIAINPQNPDDIYLATDNGVYHTRTGIGNDREFRIVEARDIVVNGIPYTEISIDGSISSVDAPAGTYILPNKNNDLRRFEVSSVEQDSGITTITVKGSAVNSFRHPLVKKDDICVLKKWAKLILELDNLNVTSIEIDPVTPSTVYCGTNTSGIYRSTNGIYWKPFSNGLPEVDDNTELNVTQIRSEAGVVYAAIRDVSPVSGGLFKLDGGSWVRLTSGDALSFDVYGTNMLLGTSSGIFFSDDSGNTWNQLSVPSEHVTALEWKNDRYSAIAGTAGMGLFSGINLGDSWKQDFSKASIIDEIRSAYWKVIGLDVDHSVDKSLTISVQKPQSDVNEIPDVSAVSKFNRSDLTSGEFEWTETKTSTNEINKNLWLDASNYAFLAKQTMNTNSPTKGFGLLINEVLRFPYAQQRAILLLNDHQIANGDFNIGNPSLGTSYDKTVTRQGGAVIQDGEITQRLLNEFFTSASIDSRISPPRDFAVRTIVWVAPNTFYIGTENAGIYSVYQPTFYHSPTFGKGNLSASDGTIAITGFSSLTPDIAVTSHVDIYSEGQIITKGNVFAVPNSTTFRVTLDDVLDDREVLFAVTPSQEISVNLKETWAEALVNPDWSTLSTGTIYDLVYFTNFIAPSGAELSKLPGAKIIFAPHLQIGNNQAFEVSGYSGGSPHVIVSVKGFDLEFDSGNTFIEVADVYYDDPEQETVVKISEKVPNKHLGVNDGIAACRFQANSSIKEVFAISSASEYEIRITDINKTAYNTITANGTTKNGFTCRFNFGIPSVFLNSSVTTTDIVPLIIPKATVTDINAGFEAYQSSYTNQFGNPEYKLVINKLGFNNTFAYAATSVGLFYYDGSSWVKYPSFVDANVVDVNVTETWGIACTRDKVYYTGNFLSLTAFSDVTPDLPEKKFNAVRVIHTEDAPSFIVATESRGIFHSRDYGVTWNDWNNGLEMHSCPIWKFASDPQEETNVYAFGFGSGVFKRISGETDDTFENRSNGLFNKDITGLAVNGDTLYASTISGGIFKSTDAGLNWTPISSTIFDSKIIPAIALVPGTETLYAIVQKADIASPLATFTGTSVTGLYKSTDAGETWVLIMEMPASRTYVLAAFDDDTVYAGAGSVLYRSEQDDDFASVIEDVVLSVTKTTGKQNEVFAITPNGKVYVSFDNGTVWLKKPGIATSQGDQGICAKAADSVFSVTKTVTTSDTTITGTVTIYTNPDTFEEGFQLNESENHPYGDFSSAKVTFGNNDATVLTLESGTLTPVTTVYAPGLNRAFIADGTSFEIRGITEILITDCDEESGIILSPRQLGGFTNLYIQVADNEPLRIAEYFVNASQVRIFAIGSFEANITGTRTVKIGPSVDGEIQPLTYVFHSRGSEGFFGATPDSKRFGFSLNYFDFSFGYGTELSIRKSAEATPSSYTGQKIADAWQFFDGDNTKFFILQGAKIIPVRNNGEVLEESVELITADTTPVPLRNGVTIASDFGYITCRDQILYSNSFSADSWQQAFIPGENFYMSGGVAKEVTSFDYPLVTAPSNDTNVAYLIVNENVLIRTTVLSSVRASTSIVGWYERTLSPDGSPFNYTYVKSLKVHPTNSETLFMCVANPNNDTASVNGLWISTNAGSTWTKYYLSEDSNASATNIEFLDNQGTQLVVAMHETINDSTHSSLYSNVFGTFGNSVNCTVSVSSNCIVTGTDYGISFINHATKTGTHFPVNSPVVSINANDIYVFVADNNDVHVFSKELLVDSEDIVLSKISTISGVSDRVLRRLLWRNSLLYVATSKGLFATATPGLSKSLTTMTLVEDGDVLDVEIDSDQNVWCSHPTSIVKVASGTKTNYVLPDGSSPRSLAFVTGPVVSLEPTEGSLYIPSTTTGDELLVVKTVTEQATDIINDGEVYNAAIFTSSASVAYDSDVDQSTITTAFNGLGDDELMSGRALILDGNFSKPKTIVSSTTNSVTVAGKVDSRQYKIAILDYVGTSDYVLFSGSLETGYIIEDLAVKSGDTYWYYIYYKSSSGKYFPAFKMNVTVGDRTSSASGSRMYVGTDSGLFEYRYESNSFDFVTAAVSPKQLAVDERFNLLCAYPHVLKYNQIDSRILYSTGTSQGVHANSDDIWISSAAGSIQINSDLVKQQISKDFITYDYLGTQKTFVKMFGAETSRKISAIGYNPASDIFYATYGEKLVSSKKFLFGWTTEILHYTSENDVVSFVFGTEDTSAAFITGNNVYVSSGIHVSPLGATFIAPFIETFPKQSLQINSYPRQQLFDGNSLFVGVTNPGNTSDGEIHFIQFKPEGDYPWINYIAGELSSAGYTGVQSTDSCFISGTALAINSYAGLVYGPITSIDYDGQLDNVWVGGLNGAWVVPYIDFLGGAIWTKATIPGRYLVSSISASFAERSVGVYVTYSADPEVKVFGSLPSGNDSINRNVQKICHVVYDAETDPQFTVTDISLGYFEERDPYFKAKSAQYSISENSPVVRRSKIIDVSETQWFCLVGNDHGELEIIFSPVESSTTRLGVDNDIAFKSGYTTCIDSDIPNGFTHKVALDIPGLLQKYRPYRASAAAIDESNPDNIYLAIFNPGESDAYSDNAPASDTCELLKSIDGGHNWFHVDVSGTLPIGGRINDISIDPTNSDVIYVAVSGSDISEHGIYYSENGGLSFSDISNGLPELPATSVQLFDDSVTGGNLYAGFLGYGVFTRKVGTYGYGEYQNSTYGYGYQVEGTDFFDVFNDDPSQDNWEHVLPRFDQRYGLGLTSGFITSIDMNDSDENVIHAATKDNGIIKSVDKGKTWHFDVEGLPTTVCTAVRTMPYDPALAFVGTVRGFYYKDKAEKKWVISQDIPSNSEIFDIEVNSTYKKPIVTFTYSIPDLTASGILILRREGSLVQFKPKDGVNYISLSTVADGSFVAYSDDIPDNSNGSVEFYDDHNIRTGVEYFYDFYSYDSDLVYTQFPDVYTNEIYSYDPTSISIQLIEGTFDDASYNSFSGVTTLTDSTKIKLTGFGTHLTGKTVTVTLPNGSMTSVEIISAYDSSIVVDGDLTQFANCDYTIDVSMPINSFKYHLLNPNIAQKNVPSQISEEVLLPVKSNTVSSVTVRQVVGNRTISETPGIHTPQFAWFSDRHSITFAVMSSIQATAKTISPLYVLTSDGIYISTDNGITFSKASMTSDTFNDIAFVGGDPILDVSVISAWVAGDNGLYYTIDNLASYDTNYSHLDGKYLYVETDHNNSDIVYAFKKGTGMLRSVNGGLSFDLIDTDVNDVDFSSAIMTSDFRNNFLVGSETEGVSLLADSVRDVFEIDIETDQKFDELSYEKFKIGDSVRSDVNSINIKTETKANSLQEQKNEIKFTVTEGNHVKFDIHYNESRIDTDLVKVGEFEANPASVPFRLRVPGTSKEKAVGLSLTQLPDNTIAAGTTKGAFLSRNGSVWSKVDNFLVPDIVYAIARLKNNITYLGTDNGTWENRTNDLIDFSPKNLLGRKVRSFWSYKRGKKTVLFNGSEEGLRITYRGFPDVLVTTPANFSSDDGVFIAWGEENSTGKVNPGGLDQKLLTFLNADRYYNDPCIVNGNPLVKANGWSGTVLVRFEGREDSGFEPINSVIYEKSDRRFVNSIREPIFDIQSEDSGNVENKVFGFPDGLVIVDNIRAAKDRENEGVDAPGGILDQDTFTIDAPYNDKTSVDKLFDRTNTWGAYNGSNEPLGAELKANTTYYYSLFAYYLRPPNFVFQSSGGGCRWIPMYSRVKAREYSVFFPIKNFPNAKMITCGAAFSENKYVVGTDDGAFYTDIEIGLTKGLGTDNQTINSILITDTITSLANNTYGYGYGYGYDSAGLDFFDVFSEEGTGYGYSEYGPGTVYGFGIGYELKTEPSILLATNIGILLSVNGGVSYMKIFDNESNGVRNVFSLTEDGDGNIYAGTDRGIFIKDSVDNTVWRFDSIPGAADCAPLGRYIGQQFIL
jgi:photosystem II stability/assembly factor-like uncharacterized protein/ligand-binding sensor domain-containing protein